MNFHAKIMLVGCAILALSMILSIFTNSIWFLVMWIVSSLCFGILLLPLGNPNWFSRTILKMRVWATPNSMAVELWDFTGERAVSMATRDRDGQLVAYWYDWNQIGQVILDPDSTVNRKSRASYVMFWLPLDPSLRAHHLLSMPYNMLDFCSLERNTPDTMDRLREFYIEVKKMAN